jgi:predicted phosphoadenosine phosphosulfate sulfurtransferase
MARIYKNENVYQEALSRIRYIFDEFEEVVVNFSGGKDSTVTLFLALEVAKEKNRLPLKVMFLDQETEYGAVVDYVRTIMSKEEVDPMWMQIPFRLFNSTSEEEEWLHCWEEGKEDIWMRQKEDISYKENIYNNDRFAGLLDSIFQYHLKDKKACALGGVRCEESPNRFNALTQHVTYQFITYGNKKPQVDGKQIHYTFYPLYDWSYTDIWKCIHENNLEYCKIYDYQFQLGVTVQNMRVSSLHHETSVSSLYYLHEIEIETWSKLQARVRGVNTAKTMDKENYLLNSKSELPCMFESWQEYRDYLTENLISKKEFKDKYFKTWQQMDKKYEQLSETGMQGLAKVQINTILLNDYHFTKLNNFTSSHGFQTWYQTIKGRYRKTLSDKEKQNNKFFKL